MAIQPTLLLMLISFVFPRRCSASFVRTFSDGISLSPPACSSMPFSSSVVLLTCRQHSVNQWRILFRSRWVSIGKLSEPSLYNSLKYRLRTTRFHSTSSTTASSYEGDTSSAQAKKRSDKKNKPEVFRADRVLANRTGKSRSECFELLKNKRIWQVLNDDELELVSGPSAKLPFDADLRIDRKHPVSMPPPLLMVYHKPKWVLSVRNDPKDRPCLRDVLTDMHPVGRLDYDTSGLLLFSSSGSMTQYLLHPKHEISKEYVAVVTGAVNERELTTKLQEGVTTAEGVHTADLLNVTHFDPVQVEPYLTQVRQGLPDEYNRTDLKLKGYLDVFDATELSTVRLSVTEGKHRMVRRILANCGHPVVSLKRERLGGIWLNATERILPEGETRELTPEETAWAESLVVPQKVKPKYVAKNGKKRHGRRKQ